MLSMPHATPEPVPAAGTPATPPGRTEPVRVVLGMPHLDVRGLCASWLLRECAHLHWHAIAGTAAGGPSTLRDRSGVRCLPSIVSVVVEGSLAAFREDAIATIEPLEAPTAAGGWRSETRIASGPASATVTLVSAFARRGGTSNTRLERADLPCAMRPAGERDLPVPSRVLRARSRSFALAAAEPPPPLVSAPVTGADLNGVGLLYFANFLRFVSMAEEVALRGPWSLPPVTRREMHWFGNADARDTLDMTAEPVVAQTTPVPRINCFSTVRRRSDGALIAACETRWG